MPNNPAAPIDDASYRAKGGTVESREVPIADHALRGDRAGHAPLVVRGAVQGLHGAERRRPLFHVARRSSTERWRSTAAANVSFHCEDPVLLEQHRGEPTHERRRPPACEISATQFALADDRKVRTDGANCAITPSAKGLPLIREARSRASR